LRGILEDEYMDLTGETLGQNQSAMICNVNKFTDGSPLYNKQFIIVRDGYIFSRKTLTAQKAKEAETALTDIERVFAFIKQERSKNKYPIKPVITGFFMAHANAMSEARSKRALDILQYSGHLGEHCKQIENPDQTIKDKAYVIVDDQGREV
jgi:hypothetical protein